jgi:hypothetical protein
MICFLFVMLPVICNFVDEMPAHGACEAGARPVQHLDVISGASWLFERSRFRFQTQSFVISSAVVWLFERSLCFHERGRLILSR